jgi:uncharacterized membrane-anchored protein YitT (DUF2179 family)
MDQNKQSLPRDLLFAILGAAIAAANINTFVYSGNLVPGGFSGLSLLIVRVCAKYFSLDVNYSLLYLLFNIPSALLVFKYVSKRFTLISLVYIVTVSVMVEVIPTYIITNDLLLISVFGGIVSGAACSLVLRGNACCGGTDFISIYFAKKKQRSIWNEIFAVNVALLIASGLMFTWESALYSIIFQFVNTEVVKAFDNRFKRSTFVIISDKAQEIAHEVYIKFHHSVTLFDAIGGYTNTKKTVLYTIVGEYEANSLIATILEIDPKAFISIDNNQRLVGNFHEKPF